MIVFFCFQTLTQLPYGKALYSYEGKEPGDLKFNKGDLIILRHKVDEHWYHGELRGAQGFLPASYIQCVWPSSQAPPQGKALYDFEMKDRDQDKDCLTFTKVRQALWLPCWPWVSVSHGFSSSQQEPAASQPGSSFLLCLKIQALPWGTSFSCTSINRYTVASPSRVLLDGVKVDM